MDILYCNCPRCGSSEPWHIVFYCHALRNQHDFTICGLLEGCRLRHAVVAKNNADRGWYPSGSQHSPLSRIMCVGFFLFCLVLASELSLIYIFGLFKLYTPNTLFFRLWKQSTVFSLIYSLIHLRFQIWWIKHTWFIKQSSSDLRNIMCWIIVEHENES